MWWALIEEITPCAEEKRRWLVVLEATTYTRIYGQQQFGKCWCVVVGKIFIVKLYACKNFLYVFCVRKHFTTKKSRLRYITYL